MLESSVVLRSNTVTTAVFSFGNASFSGLYINEVGTYVLRIYVLGYAEVGGGLTCSHMMFLCVTCAVDCARGLIVHDRPCVRVRVHAC